MSKSVLISIQPKWCELISSGKKTVEVRKTQPKLETPFKVYIYCSKQHTNNPHDILEIHSGGRIHKANGKVIGEFVCDEIYKYSADVCLSKHNKEQFTISSEDIEKQSCLSHEELFKYETTPDGHNWGLLGWHISNLKIYDKPKELSEFIKPCDTAFHCDICNELVEHFGCGRTIVKPPKSWCYVEEA